jgi:hypothetical protein
MFESLGPPQNPDSLSAEQLRSYTHGVSAYTTTDRTVRRARVLIAKRPEVAEQFVAVLDTKKMPAVEIEPAPGDDPGHYDMFGARPEMRDSIAAYAKIADLI